ncbi:ABC transporter ATP-binding protein [Streptomyces sp. CWNU-52B]|uniref:ABC transporter ATP-binding protein n=1 Tax=unclassified Streptomyces TaxID=2593676 RepID=UPI0039BFC23A
MPSPPSPDRHPTDPTDPTDLTDAAELAVEAAGLGIRHGREWTLRNADFRVPRGRVAALVGPNGDGKSSLLAVAAGLRRPTEGTIRVLGHAPGDHAVLPRVGVLLQDRPLHKGFTVAETLRLGRLLNPGWDQELAASVIAEADVPPRARVGRLSGGQRSCVALALTLGKRPDLLLLDEPMADLDPLRRHAMTAALMTSAARYGTTIVMSSHILAELHLICDYVVLMAHGRILLADDTDFVQAAHTLVTHTHTHPLDGDGDGDSTALPPSLRNGTVIESRTTGRRLTALLRFATGADGAATTAPPALDEILLAYLRNPEAPPLLAPDETARP